MSSKKPDKLLDFVTSLAGEEVLKVEEDLGAGFYKLNIGEAERRQARLAADTIAFHLAP